MLGQHRQNRRIKDKFLKTHARNFQKVHFDRNPSPVQTLKRIVRQASMTDMPKLVKESFNLKLLPSLRILKKKTIFFWDLGKSQQSWVICSLFAEIRDHTHSCMGAFVASLFAKPPTSSMSVPFFFLLKFKPCFFLFRLLSLARMEIQIKARNKWSRTRINHLISLFSLRNSLQKKNNNDKTLTSGCQATDSAAWSRSIRTPSSCKK